jgi:hypothetical protein
MLRRDARSRLDLNLGQYQPISGWLAAAGKRKSLQIGQCIRAGFHSIGFGSCILGQAQPVGLDNLIAHLPNFWRHT